MSLPVESGGRRSRIEMARLAMIERAAVMMAYECGRTWNRMTEARKDQYRQQARACIRALYPDDEEWSSWIALGARARCGEGADDETIKQSVSAWIVEVLS